MRQFHGIFFVIVTLLYLTLEQAAVTSPAVDAESLIDRERLVGGGSVSYRFEVEGTPTPTVTWYYNGGAVSEGVSVNGNELVIADPQVSHSGIYQCQVTNIIGDTQYEDSRTWILEVRTPSEFNMQITLLKLALLCVFAISLLGPLSTICIAQYCVRKYI